MFFTTLNLVLVGKQVLNSAFICWVKEHNILIPAASGQVLQVFMYFPLFFKTFESIAIVELLVFLSEYGLTECNRRLKKSSMDDFYEDQLNRSSVQLFSLPRKMAKGNILTTGQKQDKKVFLHPLGLASRDIKITNSKRTQSTYLYWQNTSLLKYCACIIILLNIK